MAPNLQFYLVPVSNLERYEVGDRVRTRDLSVGVARVPLNLHPLGHNRCRHSESWLTIARLPVNDADANAK